MLTGFKNFVMRGNVVDLAVGVVIGAAFNSVITQLTKSFLEPLITLVTGGNKVGGQFTINDVAFTYGAFINAVITFLLTAAALYFFVVLPMNKLAERRARRDKSDAEPAPTTLSDEARLLAEIRDELRKSAAEHALTKV